MKVCVVDDCNEVMWVKTETGGFTARSYRNDGTLVKIIAMLEAALTQARGELSGPVELSNVDDQALAALKELRPRPGQPGNLDVPGLERYLEIRHDRAVLKEIRERQGLTVNPQSQEQVLHYIGIQVRGGIDLMRARNYWVKTLSDTPKEVLVEALSLALATGRYVEKPSNCCAGRCRTC